MKLFISVFFLLLSTSLFAQTTVDWETVGNDWVFHPFANGPIDTGYFYVANPSVGGINTSAHCGQFIVNPNADPWAGVWCSDLPDFTLDATNCYISVMVYKNVISNFNLKLEGPGSPANHDVNVPNTVINQWEKLVFDYSSDIGKTIVTLTIIPDFTDPRNGVGSICYFDNVNFHDVLPVELTSFTAAYVGNDVQLKWATATELNNRGFEIQRSANGSAFTTIAFIEGHGTTTQQQQYSFVDNMVTSNTSYAYRLKQLDFNGAFEYSSIVNVGITLPTEFTLAQNYPNPFNPSTKISFAVPVKSDVTLEVYNLIGQKMMTLFQGSVDAGTHTQVLNADGMSSGMYLVKMIAVGENGSQFTSSKKMTLLK
jgi:hypothetical protein